MREYSEQPAEQNDDNIELDHIATIIREVVEDELPDCPTNEWFLGSVHFANMVDKIMNEIWREV